MQIAVLGGGNGSHAAAADLSLNGHSVRFWRRDRAAIESLRQNGSRLTLKDHAGTREVSLALASGDLAAALDGAGAWRRFWSVTVPGVRGAMILVAIMICVSALRIFTEPYFLTGTTGGPGGFASSFVMIIQQYARGLLGNLGYASALSVVLFFICLIPMLILARQNRKES